MCLRVGHAGIYLTDNRTHKMHIYGISIKVYSTVILGNSYKWHFKKNDLEKSHTSVRERGWERAQI